MRALLLLTAAVALASGNPLANILPATDMTVRGDVTVAPGSTEDSLLLTFAPTDRPAVVTIPVPESGRDFTKFGSFQLAFKSDSTIRWDLSLRNAQSQVTNFRVQPYEGVRATASIPVSFMTSEFMNNRQFKAYWLSNWRNHVDVSDIREISITMQPNREVRLEVGAFALSREIVPDSFEIDGPVVDEFGQWIPANWPGKPSSLDELRDMWRAEDEHLASLPAKRECPYGGWTERSLEATGFFRVERVDGRWWLVDPDRHPFFSAGLDCVRTTDPTRVAGREALFAKLPPGSGETADFYTNNIRLRYGAENTFDGWRATQTERLRAWGFNTVANWSDSRWAENASVPYVTNVSVGRSTGRWQGFPDAYSPDFARAALQDAHAQTRATRDDPHLIGYFIGNEPRWQDRNLIDRILNDARPSATREYIQSVFRDKGDSAETRNLVMEQITRQYFRVVYDAIRNADPNHLVLGIRWAGSAPEPVLRANDVFDVFSINIYRFEPPKEQIDRIVRLVDKPVMIGEFHFGAAERGYAPSLVMVRDQEQRGVAYRYYVERAASHPAIVGTHYFQFKDQPVTGRFDGENYNLGFVNQQDIPYRELVDAAVAAHQRMYAIHSGDLAPAHEAAQVR